MKNKNKLTSCLLTWEVLKKKKKSNKENFSTEESYINRTDEA